jgi:acyl-coenzyme A thioesterase PaaI-like protein
MDQSAPPGFERVSLGGGFSATLGAIFRNAATRRLGWRVGAEHANPVGVCHGGALATFADAQIVALRGSTDDWDVHTPTITLTTEYLAPIPVGAWVEAEVVIDRATRTLIFSRANFTVDGEAVGRSTAIYRNAV